MKSSKTWALVLVIGMVAVLAVATVTTLAYSPNNGSYGMMRGPDNDYTTDNWENHMEDMHGTYNEENPEGRGFEEHMKTVHEDAWEELEDHTETVEGWTWTEMEEHLREQHEDSWNGLEDHWDEMEEHMDDVEDEDWFDEMEEHMEEMMGDHDHDNDHNEGHSHCCH